MNYWFFFFSSSSFAFAHSRIEIEGKIKYASDEKKKTKSRSEVPKIRHARYTHIYVQSNWFRWIFFFRCVVIRLRFTLNLVRRMWILNDLSAMHAHHFCLRILHLYSMLTIHLFSSMYLSIKLISKELFAREPRTNRNKNTHTRHKHVVN